VNIRASEARGREDREQDQDEVKFPGQDLAGNLRSASGKVDGGSNQDPHSSSVLKMLAASQQVPPATGRKEREVWIELERVVGGKCSWRARRAVVCREQSMDLKGAQNDGSAKDTEQWI
jgi:hypothetical protein